MNTPIVSILIPVYNRENFIASCIESALSQTFADLEVVVVDNASTDSTWDICQHYAGLDSRVRVFRNEENIGPVRNWLSCVEHACGLYTKILWSDDLIHSEFLSKTIPYIDNHDIGFVYTSAHVFLDDKEKVFAHSFIQFETGIYESNKYVEAALLNQDVPYSPGCAIFRTADAKTNLLLNVPNRVNSDFSMHAIGNDLLLFLLTAHKYSKFAVVKEPLAYFRIHDGSITTSASSGKVPLHYDLAKGFFAENYVADIALLRKFNVNLLIDLLRCRNLAKSFGIKTLRDFYMSKFDIWFDYLYLIRRIGVFLTWKLKKWKNTF